MRVYGDHEAIVRPGEALEALRRTTTTIARMPPGIGRHGAVVGLFIEAAKLTQGVADAERDRNGQDSRTPASEALMGMTLNLAQALIRSWDSGFEQLGELKLGAIAAPLPAEVRVRSPEGYVRYGVYPEAYAIAARGLPPTDLATQVIGIRSIGVGLAAVVAAELGAPPPLTVRPVGPPFAREVRLSAPSLEALIDDRTRYVIVDEGPGLSGSSFAAVAAVLMDAGVTPERITFLTSHAGAPGAEASPTIRQVWADVTVVAAEGTGLIKDARVVDWAATRLGPLEGPEDLSAGAWRSARAFQEPPPWDPRTDRRKLRVRSEEGAWLLKFVGLGDEGERKAERAERLWRAGLSPESRGLIHGFLIQRWVDDAGPSAEADPTLAEVARYLAGRATLFDPPQAMGATLAELADMAAVNVEEELGAEAASRLRSRLADVEGLQDRVRPMAVDGKMDACEWVRSADGRLLKTDAVDHDAEHDLIGPQDLAWDVVGAAVELDLPTDALARETALASGRAVEHELLNVITPCYLAFRLGAARMAQGMLGGTDSRLNERAAERYAHLLVRSLAEPRPTSSE